MKKEIRIPFSWEERRPVFLEKFFYIPTLYDQHEKWRALPWSDPQLFGNEKSVCLEFCSGNGEWICQKAKEHPEMNWVAVDLRFDRCRKIWGRMQRNALLNLYVICADARILTRYYLPQKSIAHLYVNFPDPWPKKRHAKHRLLQQPFLDDAALLLKEKGEATFVTDDAQYRDQMINCLNKSSFWAPLLPSPYYQCNPAGYGASFFLDLWVKKGLSIYLLQFARKALCN